ncbi:uncharacterized protein LOC130533516 isoform X2 [Takifugu flavidus]|uniref:uncharacterized protein LOC130533516 isoform X2 n=1 Tax=Takifugu flavidus TaxID=433684 RepID=UPI00254452A4|nr:uncharacterized protein LOC130533516 isoform X2 [Takifugu flavidus]
MSSLLESVAVSGPHLLLAAQKLSIQPAVPEHREELIAATQTVFLEVVKVLMVDDDAAIRRVTAAADGVLQRLTELGSSSDIQSLLEYFQVFSQALLLLTSLTVDRANSLQDSDQAEQLLDSLETLRRCISMLHTAMCTTIKHPTNEQALQAKTYVLDKIQNTVKDIVITLKNESCGRLPGPCGHYTGRRDALLQLLSCSSISAIRHSSFDRDVRDLVFHCMAVANLSRRHCQQRAVGHCRHILQIWSDMRRVLKSSEDPDKHQQNFENDCTLLRQHMHALDRALTTAVLHQVLDAFGTAPSAVSELLKVTRQILVGDASTQTDLNFAQPLLEGFTSRAQRITQVAHFASAMAADAQRVEYVENSRACLSRLGARIASLSPELADHSAQTAQKLHDVCLKWEEETSQLLDAVIDVVDVKEFTSIAITEMVNDRLGCDEAYRQQRREEFDEQAATLLRHMRMAAQSVKRHLGRSDDPIYRNGLLVLLKQVQSSQDEVARSVRETLSGSRLNVEVYATFSDNVSAAMEHFKVLRKGLDGQQHPHLLSPLREVARETPSSQMRLPGDDACDHLRRRVDSPGSELAARDSFAGHEEDHSDEETIEAEMAHKSDKDDLDPPAVSRAPTLIRRSLEVDLLPLLYDVVTVTKAKDVTLLNRACTSVLELSNCYAQSAKEAASVVGVADRQTLESFRVELVSLTPLLVQTAQETAMSSVMSTGMLYKHSIHFSDLIKNAREVLLPTAGNWYRAVYTELRGALPAMTASVRKQINEVMTLCTDTVQLLTSSDLTLKSDQERFSVLHNKLSKAQNHTRNLVEFSTSSEKPLNQLEGLCLLWGLSVQIVLNSVDRILGTSADQMGPQKQLSILSENSLRIQEAVRLTCLNSRSAYKSKQLTADEEELKRLTDDYIKAAEELDAMPNVLRLGKSEFFQRNLLIKIKILVGHLSKMNRDYETGLHNILKMAYFSAATSHENNPEDAEGNLEEAAQTLFDRVELACKKVEDSLHYIRDPRVRCNLRSINDHLSFQISDIISRARLMAEARDICDTLSLDVLIQCWSAKAHYVLEEIRRQEGIHQEAKEQIRAGLQGRTLGYVRDALAPNPSGAKKLPSGEQFCHKVNGKNAKTVDSNVNLAAEDKCGPENTRKADGRDRAGWHREAFSLTDTSIFLRQESDSWDPEDNRIVQSKEAFVSEAKDVITNCQAVTQFIRVIANHCLDKQCTEELSLIVDQILTITNQLSIISSVNAVTTGCKSSDEILVKNAQNLLQTVLRGVRAAETACMTGLKQPEPNSDGAEATALCFQWRRKLEIHRAQETTNPDTDELGLRKTSAHPVAPSLAPSFLVPTTPSKHK